MSKVLEEHYRIHQKPIRIQRLLDFPSPCANYPQDYKEYVKKYGMPNNRAVLPYEIVVDLDFKGESVKESKRVIKKDAKKITAFFKEKNIGYQLFKSGGIGVHIHIFDDSLRKMSKYERDRYKKSFLRWIARNVELKVKLDPQGTLNMIQIEGELNRKLGRKELIEEHKVPYGEQVLPKFKYKKIKYEDYNPENLRKNKNCPCVDYFFTKQFVNKNDGRKRGLFIITGYFKRERFTDEEIFKSLLKWNKMLGEPFSEAILRSAIRNNNGLVGCRYTHELLEELGVKNYGGLKL